MIEALSLVKSYRKKKVVNNVNLHVNKGEIVGLLGPNGAGKTTTFYMIVGLINSDEGKVNLNNKEMVHFVHWYGICNVKYRFIRFYCLESSHV